jgi:hypothetical protein
MIVDIFFLLNFGSQCATAMPATNQSGECKHAFSASRLRVAGFAIPAVKEVLYAAPKVHRNKRFVLALIGFT